MHVSEFKMREDTCDYSKCTIFTASSCARAQIFHLNYVLSSRTLAISMLPLVDNQPLISSSNRSG